MASLPLTVGELIRQAFVLAQIWDPGEEQPGNDASTGEMTLNTLIAEWSSRSTLIPAYTTFTIALEQDEYLVVYNNVITDVLEANIRDSGEVLQNLYEVNLQEFNRLNFENYNARPDRFYIESKQDDIQTKTNIYFWPNPSGDFTVTVRAKVILSEIAYADTITTIPKSMFKALKYQLAKDLADIYGTTLSGRFDTEYRDVMATLKGVNRKDSSVITLNEFIENRRMRPWNIFTN